MSFEILERRELLVIGEQMPIAVEPLNEGVFVAAEYVLNFVMNSPWEILGSGTLMAVNYCHGHVEGVGFSKKSMSEFSNELTSLSLDEAVRAGTLGAIAEILKIYLLSDTQDPFRAGTWLKTSTLLFLSQATGFTVGYMQYKENSFEEATGAVLNSIVDYANDLNDL